MVGINQIAAPVHNQSTLDADANIQILANLQDLEVGALFSGQVT